MRYRQQVHFVKSTDGTRLAWAEAGQGPPLVKAANWLTHLEYDWESPAWNHWLTFLAGNFRLIRHDERGCGMSDWHAPDLEFPRWVEDLETVVAASGVQKPFALLGISQGSATALAYAVKHPEHVSHLILYGGYARGWNQRVDTEGARLYHAIVELVRLAWGAENPAFRQLFTSRFLPDGTDEQVQWFNELCRKTTTPEIAADLLEARAEINVVDLLGQVQTPTLVLHASDDQVVPLTTGQELASEIPGAEFVLLESKNHVLLEGEPAWQRFQNAVLEFTGAGRAGRHFASLSKREAEITALLCRGASNAAIAHELHISEKTVRNHVTHVFDKLGVRSRAEAIAKAHREGFVAGQ